MSKLIEMHSVDFKSMFGVEICPIISHCSIKIDYKITHGHYHGSPAIVLAYNQWFILCTRWYYGKLTKPVKEVANSQYILFFTAN